jgi:hypothetical protein
MSLGLGLSGLRRPDLRGQLGRLDRLGATLDLKLGEFDLQLLGLPARCLPALLCLADPRPFYVTHSFDRGELGLEGVRPVSDAVGASALPVPALLCPFSPGHSVRQQCHRLIRERDCRASVSVGGIPCSFRSLGAFAEGRSLARMGGLHGGERRLKGPRHVR